MAEATSTIKLPAGALASRESAKPYRNQILEGLRNNPDGIVNIDLQDVKNISGSFADECIGVLVLQIGFDKVLKRIKLINGAQHVVRSIADAIQIRQKELSK
jgi:hypothetical protein